MEIEQLTEAFPLLYEIRAVESDLQRLRESKNNKIKNIHIVFFGEKQLTLNEFHPKETEELLNLLISNNESRLIALRNKLDAI